MRQRAVFDVGLERVLQLVGFDIGVSLDLFNVLGVAEVTRIQEMVNFGQNYLGADLAEVDDWPIPLNAYYQAPLERVRPRTLRLGLTAYF